MAATTTIVVAVLCNLLLTLAAPAPGSTLPPAWSVLDDLGAAWEDFQFDVKFGLNVGDARAIRYVYESSGFSMSTTRMEGASLSKWPSAVMLGAVVNDGKMSLDDRANKYLKFWATDVNDRRYNVTLRDLLSFTSGLLLDPINKCTESPKDDYMECIEKVYKEAGHWDWVGPGKYWTYLDSHLQFAGAMAIEATGLSIEELFKKYMYDTFNMTSTTYSPSAMNPTLALGITTTGNDIENFLKSMLMYNPVQKSVQSQLELDYTQPPIEPAGEAWFGHYSAGHYYECLGFGTPEANAKKPLPPVCQEAHIQAGPGFYGYYPLIDRSMGAAGSLTYPPYYFQVAVAETSALSGIPEYLRLVAKPAADILMAGKNPANASRSELLSLGGLINRDIAFIQSELGDCECTNAQKGEPYASLSASLPADEPDKSRYEILGEGHGLTLFDVIEVHKKVGKCQCKGRKSNSNEIPLNQVTKMERAKFSAKHD
eukprot:m.334112 g.334112  ORF g.334112 m.334112 type:complete len:484 (+) comp17291_c0_seq1:48-1499(+)